MQTKEKHPLLKEFEAAELFGHMGLVTYRNTLVWRNARGYSVNGQDVKTPEEVDLQIDNNKRQQVSKTNHKFTSHDVRYNNIVNTNPN